MRKSSSSVQWNSRTGRSHTFTVLLADVADRSIALSCGPSVAVLAVAGLACGDHVPDFALQLGVVSRCRRLAEPGRLLCEQIRQAVKTRPVRPDRVRGGRTQAVALAGPGGEELWQAPGIALNDCRGLRKRAAARGIIPMIGYEFECVGHLVEEQPPGLHHLASG